MTFIVIVANSREEIQAIVDKSPFEIEIDEDSIREFDGLKLLRGIGLKQGGTFGTGKSGFVAYGRTLT